ncbi:CapA family protein [Caldimonas sp. KR1-144]|uniref:CapA family protein n=1 Tax=Caldimonas sp. KR1-144 TaxID=3400911 RepID=UPI003BFBF190
MKGRTTDTFKLLLAGDVMTGRGIDQVLAHPLPPALYEPWVHDAREYVQLAERVNGPIGRGLAPEYPWGDALAEIGRLQPDLRIVNLETAITARGQPWHDKAIHYRMDPRHVAVLEAARIDACSLANNHVLDWGPDGLADTLAALRAAGIAFAGAGLDADEAEAPAVLPLPGGARLLLFARATPDSGVAQDWAATAHRPGVALLPGLADRHAQSLRECIRRHRLPGDRIVVSLHWGGNWVVAVAPAQRRFAQILVEPGGADLVHGHSAHHPLPIEVHAQRLVLHGCGDLINDYEGIGPHGAWRADTGCLYAATLSTADGRLQALEIVTLRRRRLQLVRADALAASSLRNLLTGAGFATRIVGPADGPWQLLQ